MGDIGPPVAGVMGILFRIGITIGAVAVEMAACGHFSVSADGETLGAQAQRTQQQNNGKNALFHSSEPFCAQNYSSRGRCAILIYRDFRDKKEGNRLSGVAL